jgi:hypothetical protein
LSQASPLNEKAQMNPRVRHPAIQIIPAMNEECSANLVNVNFAFLERWAQTPDVVRQSLSKIGKDN